MRNIPVFVLCSLFQSFHIIPVTVAHALRHTLTTLYSTLITDNYVSTHVLISWVWWSVLVLLLGS